MSARRREAIVERPEGLEYRAEFVTEDEERQLLATVEALDFHDVVMRGQTARRTVRHFGFDYDYEGWGLTETDPLPAEFGWLQARCAEFAGVRPDELAQTLVSRYPPGAGIGWHRDAPMFGLKVVGVSLRSACRMRLRRDAGGELRVFELELPPRSAYVLGGKARSAWQHTIPPTKDLRYSITFRTLRRPGAPSRRAER
jgi:alkylated DNA repair protein (DNA oxidative demethylase)